MKMIKRSLFGAAAFSAMFFAQLTLAQPPATPPTTPPTPPATTPITDKPKDPATPPGSPATPAKPDAQPDTKPGDKTASPTAPTPAPSDASTQEKLVYVKMTTSKGDIIIELNNEKAPISVANFLGFVDKKFYDGTIFHRVMSNFMIQGGGFTPDMKEKPSGTKGIENEWKNGLSNKRGTIAMARTAVANSATSQFFINLDDKNTFLDQPRDGAGYAVFGKVISGMDVVDKIKMVKTGKSGGHDNVPTEPVLITSVTRMTPDEAKAAAASGGEKK